MQDHLLKKFTTSIADRLDTTQGPVRNSRPRRFSFDAALAGPVAHAVSSDRRALRFEASYESSVAEAFGNLPSSPAYLSPAFLKAEPSSMNFRC